jgi:molybdopterin synthase catalytic subunit
MAVRVQCEDFDLGFELAALRAGSTNIGALVSFCGLVRDDTGDLQTLELEHYPEHDQKGPGRD